MSIYSTIILIIWFIVIIVWTEKKRIFYNNKIRSLLNSEDSKDDNSNLFMFNLLRRFGIVKTNLLKDILTTPKRKEINRIHSDQYISNIKALFIWLIVSIVILIIEGQIIKMFKN